MKNKPVKLVSVLGIILLFIFSALTPMVGGYDERITEEGLKEDNYRYDRYRLPEFYPNNSISEEVDNSKEIEESILCATNNEKSTITSDGPMNSSWPMYCHDTHHTGRSPYSTANTTGVEKWRFYIDDYVEGSAAIDNDGIIYFPCYMRMHALYPNGTLKWRYWTEGWHQSGPAIDENGVIYVGTSYGFAQDSHLAAIYSSNGTLKWKYKTNGIFSSPAIGKDGIIYFGDLNNYINALYPNGTLRWRYKTNHVVYSSPAIGDDGTVYCGSHDSNLYALYPDNGTLKWKFSTGHWIRTSPCIADDGIIYFVSLDDYLYALYPNGTMKWKASGCAGTAPTIAQDGTIYVGYSELKAIYPNNGTVKWTFNPGPERTIRGSTPCNSVDGAIYFGTSIDETSGGEIIAVNPDGTEKWRKRLCNNRWVEFAPVIAEDGTVYIGSTAKPSGDRVGYLHAFGPGDMKRVEITNPEPGKLYLFGREIMSTPRGNTVIIGDIDVKFRVYSEGEIEGGVRFYIDDSHQCTYTEPPFEWTLDERLDRWGFGFHTLKVVANYKGGCEWTEEMKILFFHR